MLFDSKLGVYRKSTHPGTYGGYLSRGNVLHPETQRWDERPLVLHATPREYLDRLRLAREVFGDDSVVTRVVTTPSGLSIETAQTALRGTPATPEEISAEMRAAGFRLLHRDGVWFRDRDQALAWDLEGNAILLSDGSLGVFDAMLRSAPRTLAEEIAAQQ